MSEVYSHSRLSSFEDCPKKFHYRYVLKIPADSESIEAFLGKRVHEILERLYQFAAEGRVPSLARVLERFTHTWHEQYDDERVRIVRKENDAELYRQMGERCLANYYRSHYPFDADETLGIEEKVSFALDDAGSYRIRGVIDRVVRARDGVIEIVDYKTSRRVPRQTKLDGDRQLALYQLALGARFGSDQPVRLVWHYVLVNQTRTSTRTPEQLEALRSHTIALIDRIRRETTFEARKGPLCDWCEYRDRCPAWATQTSEPEAPAAPLPPLADATGQLVLL